MPYQNPLDESTFSVLTDRPANPIAGAPLIYAVANERRQQLVGIQFEVVTSVNVANRLAYVRMDDATGEVLRCHAPGVQVAAETILYNFAIGLALNDMTATNAFMDAPLPQTPRLFLPGQWAIYLDNIDAADQIQNVVITLRSWFTG